MKLLIIASEEIRIIIEEIKVVSNVNLEICIPDLPCNSIDMFDSGTFDIVIAELKYASLNSIPVQEHIAKFKPLQRVITIGDGIIGCNDKKCDECVSSYNYRRVVVPLNFKELYNTIINFDKIECRQFKCLEHLDKLIPVILKKHIALTFDLENKQIIYDSYHRHNSPQVNFYKLFQELQEYNVCCEYVSDEVIQIRCPQSDKA